MIFENKNGLIRLSIQLNINVYIYILHRNSEFQHMLHTYFKTRKPFLCNKEEEKEKYRERHLQIKSFLFKFALGQMQFSPIFESC